MGRAVRVGPPAWAFPAVTLGAQDANEGQFELAAVAGVDDGVQAAVEVAQPEDHLEQGLWWS